MADNNSPLSLVSGLLGAGAGVVGNLFNADQNQAQRDWSEKMWRLNNEYNTPANQMKRLRQAGLNPHFALQGGQLGTGNSSSPPAMTTPHPYDFSPVSQAIQSSADLYLQQRYQDADIGLKNQQAENMRIRNDYEDRRQWLDLLKLENDKDLSDETRRKVAAERELLETDMVTRSERNRAEIDRMRSEQALHDAQAKYSQAQETYQNILNKFTDKQQTIITDNLSKQGREIESAIRRNDREAALKAAQEALTNSQEHGVRIDNYTKYQMSEYVIDEKFAQAEYERYKAGNEMKRYDEGEIGYRLPAGGRKKGNPPTRPRR